MTLYLTRFVQMHESFRKAEIEALAEILGVQFDWCEYSESVRRSSCTL
jgi:tRNA (guanine10-N2)-methyltransferase